MALLNFVLRSTQKEQVSVKFDYREEDVNRYCVYFIRKLKSIDV